MGTGKSKLIALLLSAFVCPGAGQLYLKRKRMGYAILAAVCFSVIYPSILFFIEINKSLNGLILANNMAIVNSVYAMSDAMHLLKPTLVNCSIILGIAWFIGILDIIIRKDKL